MFHTISKTKVNIFLALLLFTWSLYLVYFLWYHGHTFLNFRLHILVYEEISKTAGNKSHELLPGNSTKSQPISNTAPQNNKNKVILLWNSFYKAPGWEVGLGSEPFHRLQCLVRTCEISQNRSLLNQSDAVLFHIQQLSDSPPTFKPANQRWVFFMLESPGWSKNTNYWKWEGLFNWTMSYRRDSDIQLYYGKVTKKMPHVKSPNKTDMKKKIKEALGRKLRPVAWLVSNCETQSKRDLYVEELQKYISVDVYGHCGNHTCPKDWLHGDSKCLHMIGDKYWFYLALENSLCKDYVTEKFFKILLLNTVPVVRSGVNYSQYTPRKWYINTKHFKSPKHLAQYLKHLMANPEEYIEYLKDREDYTIDAYFGIRHLSSWCHLCAKLNDAREPSKVYNNIKQWWEQKACHAPTDIQPMAAKLV